VDDHGEPVGIAALGNARVTFGGRALFAEIDFGIARGERVALVGAARPW